MRFLDHFSGHSDLYAEARPKYPEPLFRFVADHAPDKRHVWDCATGNGQAAIALAGHFDLVSASDASSDQIENAVKHARIQYSVQPAEATVYAQGAFDAVCVSQALHWFDIPLFFQEVRRVATSGGLFVAWGYDWFQITPQIDSAFDRCVMHVIKDDWAAHNALLWNGYRDVCIPFDPIEAPELKIETDWSLYQLLAYVQTWSSVKRCTNRIGDQFMDDAALTLAQLWGDPEVEKPIIMPLHIRAGRIRI